MLCSSVNQPEQVNKFMFLTQHRMWQVGEKYEWKVLFYPLCPSGVWKGLIYGSALVSLLPCVCVYVWLYTVCVSICVCVLSATVPDSWSSTTLFWPFNPNWQAQWWLMEVRVLYKSKQTEHTVSTHTGTPGLSRLCILHPLTFSSTPQ